MNTHPPIPTAMSITVLFWRFWLPGVLVRVRALLHRTTTKNHRRVAGSNAQWWMNE
jgi:hypothetical protein